MSIVTFIDLVDQICCYAKQLAGAKENGDKADTDVDPSDQIQLHRGIYLNGRPAEFVLVKKNDKAISMAIRKPIQVVEEEASDTEEEASNSEEEASNSEEEASDIENDVSDTEDEASDAEFKRCASQELEDEEEIMRSMARRKKNASPEELAPKKCREPGCTKEFKRPCDLTKHEKTHSRPWKCPVPTCKYHHYGWPTEKEMDRHHNDKHSSAPPMYECLFKPCPYKSKRESNCKQHMEKAHGWTYVRTKSNGKKIGMLSSNSTPNTAYQTPQPHGLPLPSGDYSIGVATPPKDFNPYYHSNIEFPTYLSSTTDFDIPQELTIDYSPHDHGTPSSDFSMDRNVVFPDVGNNFTVHEDIYRSTAQLPHTAHHIPNIYNKEMLQPHFPRYTPTSLAPHPTTSAHLSPIGQENTMLYTPTSLVDADEGFNDNQDFASLGGNQSGDFVLFPGGGVPKPVAYDPLFVSEVPGMGTGLSQRASQDVVAQAIQQHTEWSSYDFAHYPSSQR
ncbi:hypothetical protein P8C59_004100 [Phyllachora maydis]|uniref:C2H2-type domain-containing protein n=1 Tax=Phyllachora maydis TaxID=1825666 RepID=A0AAD9ME09_9PEZI|nr:hypothetical protein P8C59_004100 [Phyllachora maydis]